MRKSFVFLAVLPLALAVGAPAARADGTTKFAGKLYTDFSYRKNTDDGMDLTTEESTGLDVKRFYVTLDHTFNDVWSARFRTDVGDLAKHVDVFVKHAFLQAKVAPEFTVRAGVADLPWVPFVEGLYGFRYIENVLLDRTKLGTSADWGLHAVGTIGGLVSYAVSVVNGRGYGDWTRSKAPTFEGRLSVAPVAGLTIAAGGQVGTLGQKVTGTDTPNTATRVQGLVAWRDKVLRAGVEAFYAKNDKANIVTGEAPEDSALGVSGWLSYAFIPMVTGFGRFDFEQPNKDTNADAQDLYFDVGVQVQPVKAVDIALVFKYDRVKAGNGAYTLSTSNGAIGTASTEPGQTGTYLEVGAFAQYSF